MQKKVLVFHICKYLISHFVLLAVSEVLCFPNPNNDLNRAWCSGFPYGTHVLGCSLSGNSNHLGTSTMVKRSLLTKSLLSSLIHSIYLQILNHTILTLERGWTKAHGYFILMGGFMLFKEIMHRCTVSGKILQVAHCRKDRVSYCN